MADKERAQVSLPERRVGQEPASVVFLQESPPSLPSLLTLWLYEQNGRLEPEYQIVSKLSPLKGKGISEFEFASIFPWRDRPGDFTRNLLQQIHPPAYQFLSLSQRVRENSDVLNRLFGYAGFYQSLVKGNFTESVRGKLEGQKFSTLLYDILTGIALKNFGDIDEICRESLKVIDLFVGRRIDAIRLKDISGFEEYLDRENILRWIVQAEINLEEEHRNGEDWENRYGNYQVRLPVFQKEPPGILRPGETRITDWETVDLPWGNLKFLEKNRISLAIVGPPGSGKSSLAISLAESMQKFIEHSREVLPGLKLEIGLVDLDVWTPDTNIMLGRATTRKETPFTKDRATQVVRELMGEAANIVIADSPGGDPRNPANFSGYVISPADCSIVITRDWENQKSWLAKTKELGIHQVGFIHSRPEGELDEETGNPIQSAVTLFSKKNLSISGRIVGLKREVKEEDEFLETATPLLLLYILPSIVQQRHTRLHNLVRFWEREYRHVGS